MPPRRVLVTGAGGVVGRWTVRALRARGDDVVELRRRDGDVREPPPFDGIDAVVHLAAQSVAVRAVEQPGETFDVNVRGTWQVLEAARAAGVAHVVVASSNQAYGPCAGAVTEGSPLDATHPYGASKAAADVVARSYGAVVARLTNSYGAGDRQRSRLVPELAAAAAEGRPAVIHSDGSGFQDLLHASDAASALLALLEAPGGRAFNVGSGGAVSIRAIVEAAGVEATYGPPPAVAPVASWLDTTAIRSFCGWEPQKALRDGLAETLGA